MKIIDVVNYMANQPEGSWTTEITAQRKTWEDRQWVLVKGGAGDTLLRKSKRTGLSTPYVPTVEDLIADDWHLNMTKDWCLTYKYLDDTEEKEEFFYTETDAKKRQAELTEGMVDYSSVTGVE